MRDRNVVGGDDGGRVWHGYERWEDWRAGMWHKLPLEVEAGWIQKAVEFTGDAKLYGEWMLQAVDKWPVSCEHNLTCRSMNRRAWVGHAAACLAFGCPEYITRLAWHRLTQAQQDEANAMADRAIAAWERRREGRQLCLNLV